MLKFAEDNVIWREKQDGILDDSVSSDETGTESDIGGRKPSESESSSTSGREEMGDCENKEVENVNLGIFLEPGESHSLDKGLENEVLDGLVTEPTPLLISDSVQADLVLDPLSGEHLKAVKRLAGYFRLRWTEQGSGNCRRLILKAKSGPQAPAEINAAENLISKYKKIENGVTTKRLPTARCTPQVSGTQVSSFRLLTMTYMIVWRVFMDFGKICANIMRTKHGRRILEVGRPLLLASARGCCPLWGPKSRSSLQISHWERR
jgi:hypothetical protein